MAITAALVLVCGQRHQASNHDVYIEELMAGANGDSRIQFLVITQGGDGENLWGPQPGESQARAMLVFFDGGGRETGIFKFPANPPTGGSLKTLIATPEFAALRGAPKPDVLIPPFLNPNSGKVCFRNNPANTAASPKNECVAYGTFEGLIETNRSGISGPEVAAGPPAPSLPIVNTVSLRRVQNTGRNSDFSRSTTPSPRNIAGSTGAMRVATNVEQGENLFNYETFSGNGRTCATCHVAADNFALSPGNVAGRFAALIAPESSFDPLFIGESRPSAFDDGFDFNLNRLVLAAAVETGAPCIGELRGVIMGSGGGRAKVLARVDSVSYLVYGGMNPRLSGVVSDGVCSGNVATMMAGDLASSSGNGIEASVQLRGRLGSTSEPGRALILENIDGFSNPPVFRKSPHLLNLSQSAPYGLSGEFPDLQSFTTAAVTQHFPRTLARNADGPDPDFRLPTPAELDALAAFMLAQEFPPGNDPNKFDLSRFATTERQKKGLEEFVVFGCAVCHGGAALSETTVSTQSKDVGINANFNTGAHEDSRGTLPCEPSSESIGPCGSREFSTPQLFNLPHLGPYFHNGSVQTLAAAVDFYASSEFGNSPANLAFINEGVGVVPTPAITAFLEGLVLRPYAISEGPVRFGAVPATAELRVERVVVRNTGAVPIRFESPACLLTGANPESFAIRTCPLDEPLEIGGERAVEIAYVQGATGLRSSILEVHPVDAAPSGVDVYAVGGALDTPPVLLEVQPTSGGLGGGEAFILSGTNFVDGATVTVGGVQAGFISVVSSTRISARTAPHAAGPVDILVINPDGQRTLLRNAFRYSGEVRRR